jgi:hypothetical protein
MGAKVINLFVIVAAGVMLADMIANPDGTKAFFGGLADIWKTSTNGMLGKPS